MNIGIVSDTHSKPIPQQLIHDFENVDMIIHAGDFCGENDYKKFYEMKELKAVFGNMDEAKLKRLLPRRQIFKIGAVTFGLFHGEGTAANIFETVQNEFKKEKVNVVIFGHSHQPMNATIKGVLYFNPGSPNDAICAPYCSYGILEIQNDKVKGTILKVKET